MSETMLLIEDEKLLGNELLRHFQHDGWDVTLAATLADARRMLDEEEVDPLVVLSDMSLPDGNALDLLGEMREHPFRGEWIFLTGYGTVADSVRALRLGAFEFLEKPHDMARLDLIVTGAARSARAQRRLMDQSKQLNRLFSLEAFMGRSKAAASVRELLAKLSQVPFTALVLTGETGTGKGLAARILHHSGERADGPLVEVNCAALPRDLLESELFGHEAGAFTGARGRHRGLVRQAHTGTLFLDEISEMAPELQSKLLKVIEDRTVRPLGGEREHRVDVQIIVASNRDLAERVAEGTFRGDLYHRLSVFNLVLPPLRERLEDLKDLVPQFVAEYAAKSGKAVRIIPESVWPALEAHTWPGNVRELRNVIERCVLFSETDTLEDRWLHLVAPRSKGEQGEAADSRRDELLLALDGSLSLDEMESRIVERALALTGNNITAAARLLKTTRQTLRYRIEKYGLGSDGHS